MNIKDTLHAKREVTEKHIQKLQQEGNEGVRYTAMMPDIPFLVLGMFNDIGWIIHLVFGVIYFSKDGFHHVLDFLALLAMIGIVIGIGYIIYLNKIHEKEIATRLQKDLSFGLTVYSGLAGAVIGILQIATIGVSSALVWIVVGGFLNFAAGSPIYFSFKKGIIYGVK